jgi:hypothetical protein
VVFKTTAIDHSAIPPHHNPDRIHASYCTPPSPSLRLRGRKGSAVLVLTSFVLEALLSAAAPSATRQTGAEAVSISVGDHLDVLPALLLSRHDFADPVRHRRDVRK